MCLIAFAWNAHPDYRLIVGANRDEWHDRPSAPAAWWSDHPQILAGRDLQAGGTWMGVSRNGRFAAVTNFRDPGDKRSTARSRGALVTAFLLSDAPPQVFLSTIQASVDEYNGFNLIVGDPSTLVFFGSRDGKTAVLAPGVYALSNHTLNEPWPKVRSAKSALEAVLRAQVPENAREMAIRDFLSDRKIADDDALPDTGVGTAWERILSPALIVTPQYGTRASTILSIGIDRRVKLQEHTRTPDGQISGAAEFSFDLTPA